MTIDNPRLPIADCQLNNSLGITPEELKTRLKQFGLRVIKLASSLPSNRVADVFVGQLVRCGTSVAANYRAACRARTHAEFLAKLGVVEEEADETVFRMELAAEAGLIEHRLVAPLLEEGKEIVAIVTASREAAKDRQPQGEARVESAIGIWQ